MGERKFTAQQFGAGSASTPNTLLLALLQLEKYRPQFINEIVGNTEAVARLQVIAEEGNMPNVILSVRVVPPPSALSRACWSRLVARDTFYASWIRAMGHPGLWIACVWTAVAWAVSKPCPRWHTT